MDRNFKIRIVKKKDAAESVPVKVKKVTPRHSAREMVSTVSEWVADFKMRKGAETKAAFDIIRASNPRPSET